MSLTTNTARLQLTLNDDFSFVRFLKVVKTLYEASTFTQLGRTVRSALRNPAGDVGNGEDNTYDNTYDEDETVEVASGTTRENGTKQTSKQSSLLDALTSCTSPDNVQPTNRAAPTNGTRGRNDMSTIDTRETRPTPQNFLEQVMNCTLGQAEEDSDEDTYNPREGYSYDAETTTTFETMTDDGYDSPRGRRGRRRRR